MKTIYALPILAALASACGSDYHETVWTQRFDSYSESCGTEVAIDPEGNIVVIGTYDGDLSIGGDDLPRANGGALFVAKYDADGAHLWSQRLTTEDDRPRLAIDKSGNVFVAMTFGGEVTIAGESHTSNGRFDTLVVKLAPTGSPLWTRSFGTDGNEVVLDIGTDGTNIVLSGLFSESGMWGGDELLSAGDSDAFIVALDEAGEHVWSSRFGGIGSDKAQSLAVADDGSVAISGRFYGNIEAGEDASPDVVRQYASDGTLATSWGVAGGAGPVAWAADGRDLIFSGWVEAPQPLGEGSKEVKGEFLARVSPNGDPVWTAKADDREWRDMAVDEDDRVHLVSDSRSGGPGDGRFVWVTSFDADGDKLGRSEVHDSLGGARVNAVAAGPNGRIVVTGCAGDDKVLGGDESFFLTEMRAP